MEAVIRIDINGNMRRSSKRKLFEDTPVKSAEISSPCGSDAREVKRPKESLCVAFDDEKEQCKSLLQLWNSNLTTTLHHVVSIRNNDMNSRRQVSMVGAFVYFCSSAQTDAVWRQIVTAHYFSRKFGPQVFIRACPKSNKKQRDENVDDDFAGFFGQSGCFASHFQHDSCVIVPVVDDSNVGLLCRGTALIQALNLLNEPLYYREGSLTLEQFADNEVHKQEAQIKVENVDGEINLYELEGIKWKRVHIPKYD